MSDVRRKLLLVAAGIAVSSTALAQTWPAKPVRFISTFGSGSPADALMRLVGQKIAEPLEIGRAHV